MLIITQKNRYFHLFLILGEGLRLIFFPNLKYHCARRTSLRNYSWTPAASTAYQAEASHLYLRDNTKIFVFNSSADNKKTATPNYTSATVSNALLLCQLSNVPGTNSACQVSVVEPFLYAQIPGSVALSPVVCWSFLHRIRSVPCLPNQLFHFFRWLLALLRLAVC